MVEESKGNAFCQILHDGVTLGNKSKYQAFGLQFTNAKFECNHVVALGFKKVRDSTTHTVSALGKHSLKIVQILISSKLCCLLFKMLQQKVWRRPGILQWKRVICMMVTK